MPIRFRDPAIKKTGIRSEKANSADYTGLSGALSFKRNKFSGNKNISPHLKQLDVRQTGFRQASVPIRGLHSKAPQRGISLSARAAARGGFSFDKVKRDDMKRDLNYNRNPNVNPYR
jgi:hypothetical protein